MMSSLRRRLQWLTLCAFGLIVFQLTWQLLLVLNYEWFASPNVVHKRVALPSERVRVHDLLAWREFIARTPTHSPAYYNYNQRRSDNIGAVRALPDTRDAACALRSYTLPAAWRARVSVVICFHNEARSTLLRTIVSLNSRTPSDYLQEFILIDDCSDDAQLLQSLVASARAIYGGDVAASPRLITARNTRRLGLIASRNRGARLAVGDYLLFLDSHCEVNVGWLEPLLERLASDSRRAVSPVLDSIDAETLTYRASSEQLVGAFDWSLHFHWLPRTAAHSGDHVGDSQLRRDSVAPVGPPPSWHAFKSPVFAGGIFMIARNWFFELEAFNAQLQIWGGESIEFSIKLWLCGGQIEIVPCSRIGHIFRKQHAFQFPLNANANTNINTNNNNNIDNHNTKEETVDEVVHEPYRDIDSGQATYLRNSKIIAESWLDAYKEFYYALKPAAKRVAVNISQTELGRFKRTMHCRSFAWYLQHVFQQLKLPNEEFTAFGALRNGEHCLHAMARHQDLHMASCYRVDITHWYLRRAGGQLQARRYNTKEEASLCLRATRFDADNDDDDDDDDDDVLRRPRRPAHTYKLSLAKCSADGDTQRWLRRGAQLVHAATHLCLDNPLKDILMLSPCRYAAPSQVFLFAREVEHL